MHYMYTQHGFPGPIDGGPYVLAIICRDDLTRRKR